MARQLSEKTVDALLDKLAEDDDFRSRFMANPKAATASLGTGDEAVDTLPEAPIAKLAPKPAIRQARGVLRRTLLASRSPFEPINFEIPQ